MVKKPKTGKKGRISRWYARARRRGRSRGITIPIARMMAVGATALTLVGGTLKGAGGDVLGSAQAGNYSAAVNIAAYNMRQVTAPQNLLPVVVPALFTGFLGMGLDMLRANPTIKIGRFKLKAV